MKLNVIITTSPGREPLLKNALFCLKNQSRLADQIWVVDDGSESGADICRAANLPLTHLWRTNDCNVAYSRNLGAAQSSEGILVFIDSDMLLNPLALEAYCDYLSAFPHQVLYGYFGYLFEALAPSLWIPNQEVMWCDRRFEQISPEALVPAANMLRYPHEWAWSGNFALLKQNYDRIGGFDTRFQGWGGEDLDFASRLLFAGIQIHFFLDAWAEHQYHGRQERFHTWPESQKKQVYQHHYTPASYMPQMLYSETGWKSLRHAIFSHYLPLGKGPWDQPYAKL